MKTQYDPETDALYVRFAEVSIVESEEVAHGVVLDFDAEGRLVAIEFAGRQQAHCFRRCTPNNDELDDGDSVRVITVFFDRKRR